jgi:hypothetical protein
MTDERRFTHATVRVTRAEKHAVACSTVRRRDRARHSWWIVSLVCIVLAGCGGRDNRGRLPISGTVKLDGRPMTTGYIIFEPKSGQTMQSGGMIQPNGTFEVPAENGAAAGTYSVAIFSGAVKPVNNFEPGTPEYEAASMRQPGEQVPAKYNVDSILTVEVKPDDKNEFKFDLSTKK